MTLDRMAEIIERLDAEAERHGNAWRLTVEETRAAAVPVMVAKASDVFQLMLKPEGIRTRMSVPLTIDGVPSSAMVIGLIAVDGSPALNS